MLSPEELAELGRSPLERHRRALERGDQAEADAIAAAAERGWQRGIDGYAVWRELTVAYLTEAIGAEAGASADAAFADAYDEWTPWRDASEASDDAFVARASRYRDLHDRGLDAVCAQITHVYRTHGIDELEQSMRAVGDETLLAWMPRDIERSPEVRIRTWAALLQGNFAEITIEEDDERFVITQDPCGSCGRQLECGAFPGPLDHAVVTEVHPITFDRGDVPIYRTHVAVLHFLVPGERIGVPWPVVACPRGTVPGPCRVTLYKDPRNPAAHRDAELLRGAGDA